VWSWAKQVQLLLQVVPHLSRLGVLRSTTLTDGQEAEEQQTVRRLGITTVGGTLDYPLDEAEYRRAFTALVKNRADAVIIDVENLTNRKLIVELAETNRLPAIYPLKVFVETGGLMSYGSSQLEHGRNLADVADKVIKGANPSDGLILLHSWYPNECCADKDCHPVPCDEISEGENGAMHWKNLILEGSQIRTSPDSECHVCHLLGEGRPVIPICIFTQKKPSA
jgi:hypothetical protein